jgi:type II secretion system protein I
MISATGGNKNSGVFRPRAHHGFTLIEILVAVAILSLGLIMVLQGITRCSGLINIAQDNLAATLLAEEKMAEMEIAVRQEGDISFEGANGDTHSGNASLRWQVELSPDPDYEGLYSVTDTVYWTEGKRSGITSLDSYLMIINAK